MVQRFGGQLELYLRQEGIKDSMPVRQHDHGLDALRYAENMRKATRGW